MRDKGIKSIVVVGGGSAGWMSAAYFARKFSGTDVKISLIESSHIGTVGVGEATVPSIKCFLSELGIDEKEFIRSTNATLKLGIEFEGWREKGENFFHPFGRFGSRIGSLDFIHYWMRNRSSGCRQPLDSYSLPAQIARSGKFAIPKRDEAVDEMLDFNYAYHFDASLFAQYLKSYSDKLGVRSVDGTIKGVRKNKSTGEIEKLILENGSEVYGDFYIDCTGFSGVLVNSIDSEYEDWSRFLPCDRAVSVQTGGSEKFGAYTRSVAMSAGWRWEIPLQNRMGNGYVYSSNYIDDDSAREELLGSVVGAALNEPKVIKFKPGQRKRVWVKNVFSVGLSSGFLEPLESTSLYIVQYSLAVLFNNFPLDTRCEFLPNKVNGIVSRQVHNMRDFIIAHYCSNDRESGDFWRYCRNMELPGTLVDRMEEFKISGSITLGNDDFFKNNSWNAVLLGMGVIPDYFHPKLNFYSDDIIREELSSMRKAIEDVIPNMPTHHEFLKRNFII